MAISLKSNSEIAIMREANKVVIKALDAVQKEITSGITTLELDEICESVIRENGAVPSFKGYKGFPSSLCISVNEEVVHGIPSKKKKLKEGDIVSIDTGTCVNGYYGDAARTVGVGNISKSSKQLIKVTSECLDAAIEQCKPGNRLGDVSNAIETIADRYGYGVVVEFVGHGIGRSPHEEPQVPNRGAKGTGIILHPGLVIAIEPMINLGTGLVKVLKDDWTVITRDKKLSAHFEHSVAITEDGSFVLSA